MISLHRKEMFNSSTICHYCNYLNIELCEEINRLEGLYIDSISIIVVDFDKRFGIVSLFTSAVCHCRPISLCGDLKTAMYLSRIYASDDHLGTNHSSHPESNLRLTTADL